MQVSVEKVSSVERRVTIIVPSNQLEDAYTRQLSQIAKTAKIKGFSRPGKIPMSFISKRFGSAAREEALKNIIKETLSLAITDEKIIPLNTPVIEVKTKDFDQPLEYTASFEVLPEIETVNASLVDIERMIASVTEDDMERVIKQLMKQHTTWKLIERETKLNDRLVIDYYAIFEDQSDEENKVTDYSLELGSNMMLPGFEEGLIGAKVGEERKLELQFPDDFSFKERAGKSIVFIVNIKQVFEPTVPVLNEDFIKKLGIPDGKLEGLKLQIKQMLEQECSRLVKEKLKEQIFKQLLEQNTLQAPSTLIAQEAEKIHDQIYQNRSHDHAQHSPEELTQFNQVAEKRVTLGLLLTEYAKQNNLQVDPKRVNARIQEIASIYERPEEVITLLSTGEQRKGVESQILEDQVIESLIKDLPMIERTINYTELKGIRI